MGRDRCLFMFFFFFQAEDGIRDGHVTGVQTCALPILEQADGTAWMALFSQNMMELAFELTAHDPSYEPMIMKFAEHFFYIGAAMNRPGQEGMWDEEDGFYYDLLRLPDGSAQRLKVR